MGLNWGTLINEMIAAVLPLTRVFKAMGIDIGEAISGWCQVLDSKRLITSSLLLHLHSKSCQACLD